MTDYWTSFAKTSNPNSSGVENWTEHTAENPHIQKLKG